MARLLVVDDKANIRKVLRIILEKEGHKVETASSGREVVSAANLAGARFLGIRKGVPNLVSI